MTEPQSGSSSLASEARGRVLRLLDFLAAYDASKNPPVHDIATYGLYVLRGADLPDVDGVHLTPTADAWLTVDFVDLPPRPPVPADLEAVLGAGAMLTAKQRPTIDLPDEPTPADLDVALRGEQWVVGTWQPWSDRYRDAEAAKGLYRDLFEQRARLATDRESIELVWGFRRLRWTSRGAAPVDHPLLSMPVEIDLDTATGQLRVRPAGALEAESLFLADVEIDDRAGLNALRQGLVEVDVATDPWDIDATEDLARRMVRAIDHDGVLDGEGDAAADTATADASWVLFLRRRRPDYQGFLDEMRRWYEADVDPPDPLRAVVVDAPSLLVDSADGDGASWAQGTTAEPLLLPLPTNAEQQRILTLAQHRPGVTVQGPPGTGKSHTIANIISHHVAYGRKVLVVAEKEQALRVLADKVPEGIRDLTVSVLGAEEDGRRRLESSISQIQTRVTGLDQEAVDQEVDRLTKHLDRLDQAVAVATDRLLAARRTEVTTFPGQADGLDQPTPLRAAEWVAREAARLGYIDDEVAPGSSPALSRSELADYLQLLVSPGVPWAEAAAYRWPELQHLPTASALNDAFARLDAFAVRSDQAAPEIHRWERIDAASPDLLASLSQAVRQEQDWLTKIAGTWLDRVRLQVTDAGLRDEWSTFVSSVQAERQALMTTSETLEAYDVVVPSSATPAFTAQLIDARKRFAEKGRLGRFAGDARQAVEVCRVNGRAPASGAEVDLCLAALRRAELRHQLATRWANRMARCDGPQLHEGFPEDVLVRHLEQLEGVLGGKWRWEQLRVALGGLDIAAPAHLEHESSARLMQVLAIASERPGGLVVADWLGTVKSYLATGGEAPGASSVWHELTQALAARDLDAWTTNREGAEYVTRIASAANRLNELRRRLQSAAPRWSTRIDLDRAAAGDPALIEQAWAWRQLDTWLDGLEGPEDPSLLQRLLEQLALERRKVVTDLVTERAWRRLADNMGDRERQALNSYVQAVRRYGKTGGKFAARWLTQIREALNESKHAVPVWIMTTNRALASFRPDATPPFDVLVIDEASQIGLEALPLLSLAKTAIVVGDDKQTSPENVGLNRTRFFGLLDEYLSTVPKYRTLFDADNSLYDVAFQKFPDVVMLTEHFRSLPPIIQFSNQHFYDGRIIPLRDDAPAPGWQPVRTIKVSNGYRVGDLNEPEAETVVDLLVRMCDDPTYDGMDFGVVSLLGSTQSKHIWDRLYERLGPEVMTARNIRCGEPANLQGDERNVVILSTVVATDPNNPNGRIGAMTGRAAERRLNVAASRARDQMWVVHSVEPDRFPQGDPRASLIRHCRDLRGTDVEIEDLATLQARCDSDFERLVLGRIAARGYRRIRPQYLVGRYRIDIVVEGPHSRLAIECDGDRWHGEDQWHQDRARQEVLERAGWTFVRIRGSAFYRDPDRALEVLWQRLDELGIPTGDEWLLEPPAAVDPVAEVAVDDAGLLPLPPMDDVGSPRHNQLESAIAAGAPSDEAPNGPTISQPTAEVRAGTPRLDDETPVGTTEVHDLPTGGSPPGILAPYRYWTRRPLVDVSTATYEQVIAGLVDIVADEGPMHALSAYQIYVRASGGERVGKEMRRTFNQVLNRGLRERRLVQIDDALDGQIGKTLYAAGGEPVVVRALGPRKLNEVPLSEISRLVDLLGLDRGSSTVARAVLDALGLVRLTENTQRLIDDALAYTWSE